MQVVESRLSKLVTCQRRRRWMRVVATDVCICFDWTKLLLAVLMTLGILGKLIFEMVAYVGRKR